MLRDILVVFPSWQWWSLPGTFPSGFDKY